MIKSFSINGYRKFNNFKVEGLSHFNIFLGNNNVGKTSILESIFAFACGNNVGRLIEQSILRRLPPTGTYDFIEKVNSAFNLHNRDKFVFAFEVIDEKGKKSSTRHTLKPGSLFGAIRPDLQNNLIIQDNNVMSTQVIQNGIVNLNVMPSNFIGEWQVSHNNKQGSNYKITFPYDIPSLNGQISLQGRYVDILSHRNQQENTYIYSCLKRERIINEFIDELKKMFNFVSGIDSVPYPDGSSSPVSIQLKNGELVPLYNFGDGFQRWFNILGGMVYQKNGIHCIEEVDVTFHNLAQENLAKNLFYYSKRFNNQVFLTTHSIEFIDNLFRGVNKEMLEEVRIITLRDDPKTGELKHRVLSGVEALEKREEYNLELR